MRIGDLSKATGISIPTIRLYEREGLISPAARTEGRFREFSEEQQLRLDFIKRVRSLGFTFDEVKVLLALAHTHADSGKPSLVKAILSGIKERKRDLAQLEDRLSAALSGAKPFEGIEDAFKKKK
jgi:DNA-binding transcriptional MerR regulator